MLLQVLHVRVTHVIFGFGKVVDHLKPVWFFGLVSTWVDFNLTFDRLLLGEESLVKKKSVFFSEYF